MKIYKPCKTALYIKQLALNINITLNINIKYISHVKLLHT